MSQAMTLGNKRYVLTAALLLALLGVTYLLAHVNLGWLNTPAALAIAAVKALIVGLYFMHLRSSHPLQRIAACVGVFWLGILLMLAMTDYRSRGWLNLPGSWPRGPDQIKRPN